MVGLVGSVLLFVGVFIPIVSSPIFGSITYFNNGNGDGVLVLVLASVSALATIAGYYGTLWVTGAGSLGLVVFSLVSAIIRLPKLKTEVQSDLANNPFHGLADVAINSVQIQVGWAVLLMGALLLITCAALSADRIPASKE